MQPTPQPGQPAGDLSAFFGQQGGAFDTHSVQPQEDLQYLPPGDYPVLVDKAEIKATKAGKGLVGADVVVTVLDFH